MSAEKDAAGTRPCTADRSKATRLSWSGRSPAVRAGGAASAQRTGIKVGYSRSPCRWPPLKSRNPREKTSACWQTCWSVRLKLKPARRSSCQRALLGTVDSEVVLKARCRPLYSRRGLGSAM